MGDILTKEEIDALLEDTANYEEAMYKNMSAAEFAICIIQGVHERITEFLLRNNKNPSCTDIVNYYYDATQELSKWLTERPDRDDILNLINENSENYKCKIRLFISPIDGSLKKY